MDNLHPRIKREIRTVKSMVKLYCLKHHRSDKLCVECSNLLEYSIHRLEKCPFREGKTTCAKCPTHCYTLKNRESIREVMRYSGPRMLYRHPIAAVWHLIDAQRRVPIHHDK